MLNSVKFFDNIITPSIGEDGRIKVEIIDGDYPIKLNIQGDNVIGTRTWISRDVSKFLIESDTTVLTFYKHVDESNNMQLDMEVSLRV